MQGYIIMFRSIIKNRSLFFNTRKNPYSILGVSSTANEDEIKSAYYKLAKQYHPDVNPSFA